MIHIYIIILSVILVVDLLIDYYNKNGSLLDSNMDTKAIPIVLLLVVISYCLDSLRRKP